MVAIEGRQIRPWAGAAAFQVAGKAKKRQAVVNVNEAGRQITREYHVSSHLLRSAVSTDKKANIVARHFPVFVPGGHISSFAVLSDHRRQQATRVRATMDVPKSSTHLLMGYDEVRQFIAALPARASTVAEALTTTRKPTSPQARGVVLRPRYPGGARLHPTCPQMRRTGGLRAVGAGVVPPGVGSPGGGPALCHRESCRQPSRPPQARPAYRGTALCATASSVRVGALSVGPGCSGADGAPKDCCVRTAALFGRSGRYTLRVSRWAGTRIIGIPRVGRYKECSVGMN